MTNVTMLANQLQEKTEWQQTPTPLTQEQYEQMIVAGLKTLYIDTGRAFEWREGMVHIDDDTGYTVFDRDLGIDEEKYVLLTAMIEFFQKVQGDVNTIVSYTTDALSVTNADKPYAHLQDSIEKNENERRIVYYKMSQYWSE